jgi:hypothetical protein
MDLFPFSEADWEALSEAARAVLNATLADDAVLQASHMEGLREVLDGLRTQYGEHPLLLETEADFVGEPLEQVALYQRARDVALACGWPTLSIRIALARVLLEDLSRPREARDELLACQHELATEGEPSDHEDWSDLLAECDRQSKLSG